MVHDLLFAGILLSIILSFVQAGLIYLIFTKGHPCLRILNANGDCSCPKHLYEELQLQEINNSCSNLMCFSKLRANAIPHLVSQMLKVRKLTIQINEKVPPGLPWKWSEFYVWSVNHSKLPMLLQKLWTFKYFFFEYSRAESWSQFQAKAGAGTSAACTLDPHLMHIMCGWPTFSVN